MQLFFKGPIKSNTEGQIVRTDKECPTQTKTQSFFFLETFEHFFFFSNNLNFFQYYSFKRKTDETQIFDSLNSVEFSELKNLIRSTHFKQK